jgi:hypothetical protein
VKDVNVRDTRKIFSPWRDYYRVIYTVNPMMLNPSGWKDFPDVPVSFSGPHKREATRKPWQFFHGLLWVCSTIVPHCCRSRQFVRIHQVLAARSVALVHSSKRCKCLIMSSQNRVRTIWWRLTCRLSYANNHVGRIGRLLVRAKMPLPLLTTHCIRRSAYLINIIWFVTFSKLIKLPD